MSNWSVNAAVKLSLDKSSLAAVRRDIEAGIRAASATVNVKLAPGAGRQIGNELQAAVRAAQAAAPPVSKLAAEMKSARLEAVRLASATVTAEAAAQRLAAQAQTAAAAYKSMAAAAQQAATAANQAAAAQRRAVAGPGGGGAGRPPGGGGGPGAAGAGAAGGGNPFGPAILGAGKLHSSLIALATGYGAVAGAAAGLGRAIQSNVKDALEFQRQLVRLQQVGASPGEARAVGRTVTGLSVGLGVDSGELAKTAVTLKQAGLSATDTRLALDALAKTGLAPTFDSIGQSTEGLIASMRQFGLAGKDAGRVLGSMNSLSAAYAAESSDLIAAVQRGGAAFAASGGQLEEYLSLVTAVRSTTRESAESIGSGLRTIFTRLQRPRTADFLATQGINLRYSEAEARAAGDPGLEGQQLSGFEAVGRLSQGLSRLRSTDPRFSAVVEEIGGYRQVSKVLPLIQQYAEAQKGLNVARAGEISLTLSAEQAQEAYLVRLQKVAETWKAFGRDLTDSAGFKAVADGFIGAADGAARLAGALTPLLHLLAAGGAARLAGMVAPTVGAALTAPLTRAGTLSAARAYGPAALGVGAVIAGDQIGGPAGGALSGAGMGAAAGMAFGPWGAAIGGAVGALNGFTSAVREAAAAARAQANEADTAALGTRLDSLSRGGSSADLASASAYVRAVRGRNREAAADKAAERVPVANLRTGGIDARTYADELRAGDRRQFGGQLTSLTAALNTEAERLGRAAPGADPARLADQFRQSTRELVAVVGSLSDRPDSAVLGDFRKVIEAAQTSARNQANRQGVEDATRRTVTAFGRLVDAAEKAARGLSLVDEQTAALGAGPEQVRPGQSELTPANAARYLGVLGADGRGLADSFRTANDVERVLPGILARAAAGNPLDGESLSQAVRAGLRDALGDLKGERGRAADVIGEALDREDLPTVLRSIGADSTGFARSLSSGYASAPREATGQIAAVVRGVQERVVDLLNRAARSAAAEGDATDRLAELTLSSARQRAINADRRPGDVLPVDELQQPFSAQQRRLAGPLAFDVGGMAGRLGELRSLIPQAVAARESAAPGREFAQAAERLGRLTSEADNLRNALRQLTDANKAAAGIQEKLNGLQSDRDARLSYGERFFSADRAGRRDMNREYAAAVRAAQAGDLRQLSVRDQQRAIAGFRGLGAAVVPEMGGRRADEVMREVLGRSGFGLPADRERELSDLKSQLEGVFTAAEAAQRALIDDERAARLGFLSQLADSQTKFLDGLRSALNETKLADEQVKAGDAGRRLGELRGKQGSFDVLRAAGVQSDDQLERLRLRRPELTQYAEAARRAAEMDRVRQDVVGRLRDPSGFTPDGDELDYGAFSGNRRGPNEGELPAATTERARAYLDRFADVLSPDQRDRILKDYGKSGYLAARSAQAAVPTRGGAVMTLFDGLNPVGDRPGGVGPALREWRDAGAGTADPREEVRKALQRSLQSSILSVVGQDASAQKAEQTRLYGALAPAGVNRQGLDRAVGTGGGQGLLRALDAFDNKDNPLSGFGDRLRRTQTEFDGLGASVARLRASLDGATPPVAAPGFASGGPVPGRPKGSDTVPAWLTPGEYVVNAKDAARNRPLLDAVNRGASPPPAYMADGGIVDWLTRRPQWGRDLDDWAGRQVMRPFRAVHEGIKRAAGIAPPPDHSFKPLPPGTGPTVGERYFRRMDGTLILPRRGMEGRSQTPAPVPAPWQPPPTATWRPLPPPPAAPSVVTLPMTARAPDPGPGVREHPLVAVRPPAPVPAAAPPGADDGLTARRLAVAAALNPGGPADQHLNGPGRVGLAVGRAAFTERAFRNTPQGAAVAAAARARAAGAVGYHDGMRAGVGPAPLFGGGFARPAPVVPWAGRPAETTTGRTLSGGDASNGVVAKALQEFAQKGPALASALTGFGASADRLIDALKGIPERIEMSGKHEHSVNLTGGDAVADRVAEALTPAILAKVDEKIHGAIDSRVPNANQRSPGGPSS